MRLKTYTDVLQNFLTEWYQSLIAIAIVFIGIERIDYARDFTSGRLEYKWNFATITSQDVKLATIMFLVGAITWYGVAQGKRRFKQWRNS